MRELKDNEQRNNDNDVPKFPKSILYWALYGILWVVESAMTFFQFLWSETKLLWSETKRLWWENQNAKYALIGIVGASIILLFLAIGLIATGNAKLPNVIEGPKNFVTGIFKDEPRSDFIERWKSAVEGEHVGTYSALWDKTARRENQVSYERALKLVLKEGALIDISNLRYKASIVKDKAYFVREIPFSFIDEGVRIGLLRRITFGERGIPMFKEWKILGDESYNFLNSSGTTLPLVDADTANGEPVSTGDESLETSSDDESAADSEFPVVEWTLPSASQDGETLQVDPLDKYRKKGKKDTSGVDPLDRYRKKPVYRKL